MKHNRLFLTLIFGLLLVTFISGCINIPVTPSVEKELDDASGVSITEIGSGPTLSATLDVIPPKGKITVNFSGAPGNYRDWIGLFKVGSSNYSRISYQYLKGQRNGTVIFTAPSSTGQYEFRLFKNGSYSKLATSNQVTVQKGALNPTPTPTPTSTSTSLSSSGRVAPSAVLTSSLSNSALSQSPPRGSSYSFWSFWSFSC